MKEYHSVFEYIYRDASNYKEFGYVLVRGTFGDDDVRVIESAMNSDGMFVPDWVDIPPLQTRLESFPSEDDHVWHEFTCLRSADGNDLRTLECWGSVQKLVANFAALASLSKADFDARFLLLSEREPYSLLR